MSKDFYSVGEGLHDSTVKGLYHQAFHHAKAVAGQVEVFGKVVKIEQAEKLKIAAYNKDIIAMEAFKQQDAVGKWYQKHHYKGMMEGRVTASTPEARYLLLLFQNGGLYLKWVEGRYEDMKEEIRLERIELRHRMYRESVKRRFLELVKRIANSKD